MMMNRYIAALFVVLAATGMEAHTCQYALKYAVGDLSCEEFIKQSQVRVLEDDLIAIIKALKKTRHHLFPSLQHHPDGAGRTCGKTHVPLPFKCQRQGGKGFRTSCSPLAHGYWKSIIIRGPCSL